MNYRDKCLLQVCFQSYGIYSDNFSVCLDRKEWCWKLLLNIATKFERIFLMNWWFHTSSVDIALYNVVEMLDIFELFDQIEAR